MDTSNRSVWWLSCSFISLVCLLLCFRVCALSRQQRKGYQTSSPSHREALRALSSFIIPTRARWSPDVITKTIHVGLCKQEITLDLSMLLRDIIEGRLELRDGSDLASLFRNVLYVDGFLVSLRLGTSWWIRVFAWTSWTNDITKETPSSVSVSTKARISNGNTRLLPPVKDLQSTLILDLIPFAKLHATIKKFIESQPRGTTATIDFTALAPHVESFSTDFILCAIPFLPRQFNVLNDAGYARTSSPLLVSLKHVVEIISSIAPSATIHSVVNSSREYEELFYTCEQELVDDKISRTTFVERWGEGAWREHRLFMVWEAGLFSAGLLDRWVVGIRT